MSEKVTAVLLFLSASVGLFLAAVTHSVVCAALGGTSLGMLLWLGAGAAMERRSWKRIMDTEWDCPISGLVN